MDKYYCWVCDFSKISGEGNLANLFINKNFYNNYLIYTPSSLITNKKFKNIINYKYISPFNEYFGKWTDEQVPNTYSHYADIAMETLLLKLQPLVEKKTNLKLIPNYSYARIYKKGDILHRHKDRFSCEISTTLNLGGEVWPIYLNIIDKDNVHKEIKINLKPGDMLIYNGNLLEHWRDSFDGEDCAQVFLHYNNVSTKGSKENMFDGRLHLGLPRSIKK